MKKLFAFLFFVVTISAWSQTKMAYINSQSVMEQLPEAQDAQKQLDALTQEWQSELTKMAADIQKKVDEYDKRKLIMTDKRRSEVEKELQDLDKKLVDYRNQKFGTSGELFTKQNELMKPIQEKIFKAVKDVADAEGYDYVVDRSSSTLLLFANSKHDLTQKVLEKVQQK
ncbi:MAG: OmpH family outer membrane protein [Ignavibacteriales bacterium]|nr:OmpH family outer membrane protein [Ignavibacteriales bacterium]